MGAQKDAKNGSQSLELKLGTWNVQALGWGLLQMLLGMSCLDAQGAEGGGAAAAAGHCGPARL